MRQRIDLALRVIALLAIALPYARPLACQVFDHASTTPLAHVVDGSAAHHSTSDHPTNAGEPGDGGPASESVDCHALMHCGVAPVAPTLQAATLDAGPAAETNLDPAPPASRGCQAGDLNTPPPRA